jgi:hypothetical protein
MLRNAVQALRGGEGQQCDGRVRGGAPSGCCIRHRGCATGQAPSSYAIPKFRQGSEFQEELLKPRWQAESLTSVGRGLRVRGLYVTASRRRSRPRVQGISKSRVDDRA